MTSVDRYQNTAKYEHTPHILERRRSLFPPSSTESEEDSDLGPMSPLSYDSNCDQDDVNSMATKSSHEMDISIQKPDTIGDYDILEVVENSDEMYTPNNTKCVYSVTMSPLVLSPYPTHAKKISEKSLSETPCNVSPSQSLKTPHDTSNVKSKLPKLVRKSSLLDLSDTLSNKRKLSPDTSPEPNKQIKLDPNSRVRTTLFPEISLPTKKFYSSTEDIMEEILNRRKSLPKPPATFNTKRKNRKPRKNVGSINAGVNHNIRKPRKRYANKPLVKTVMNVLQSNAMKSYLEDLKELNSNAKGATIMLENKENKAPEENLHGQVIMPPQQIMVPPKQIIVPPKQIIMPPKQIIMPPRLPKFIPNPAYNESEISKKRPLSPSSDEPQTKKKFFKFSRASKGVVTVNKNIKVQIDHGKLTILDNNKSKLTSKISFDSNDFSVEEESELPQTNIDGILSSLNDEDNKIENRDTNTLILQAHNSIRASENSILLHHEPSRNPNLILSPISQMCNVTSGLVLNSPKGVKNLSSVLNKMSSTSQIENINSIEEEKLFSIFSNPNSGIINKKQKVSTPNEKKPRKLDECQMLLDAGQKRFGATECPECQFVYHTGDASDESMHTNYHLALHILRFNGWKNERVVADFQYNGRIIQILPGDSKLWWKRVNDLMELVSRELGCYEMEFKLEECQVYLYIKNRKIVGCLVAVAKSEGHKMLETKDNQPDLCSEEKYPIRCGVPRIWVSHNERKQGVATKMMDTLKKNFSLGHILINSDVAISSPSEMGKNFAKTYFQTPNYLIYFV